MNILLSVSKDDIPIIDEYLKILVEKHVLQVEKMNQLCGMDAEKAKTLATLIVRKEYARFHAYNDGTLASNEYTKEAYEQKYLEKEINSEFDKKEKEELFMTKTELEIDKLKRDRWMSIASFIISIFALIMSAISLIIAILK